MPHEFNPAATVYVVDPNLRASQSVIELARRNGLECHRFHSAESLLTLPHRSHPACLVIDAVLPGMSGLELQQKILSSSTPLPIIVISDSLDVDVAVRFMENGAFSVLEKPFGRTRLAELLSSAIRTDAQNVLRERRLHDLLDRERLLKIPNAM